MYCLLIELFPLLLELNFLKEDVREDVKDELEYNELTDVDEKIDEKGVEDDSNESDKLAELMVLIVVVAAAVVIAKVIIRHL